MPAFIKTPWDESRWAKAKEAANKSHSESEGDSYWKIVNSIYQKMTKSDESIEEAIQALKKARQKMADEYDPNEAAYEEEPEATGTDREFDPDEEQDDAAKWLGENDPEAPTAPSEDYEEYSPEEDEDTHRADITEDLGDDGEPRVQKLPPGEKPELGSPNSQTNWKWRNSDKSNAGSKISQADLLSGNVAQYGKPEVQESVSPKEASTGRRSRFEQPSREDLMAMRQYTRPWEQRARETQQLKADPSRNPQLARQGNIVEARNASHGDRSSAYRAFTNSDEYKKADPIQQMEMDDQFENNWKQQNPEHLKNALTAHQEAHEKGKGAKDLHAAAKDAQIRNIISGGGHGGEGYSLEEGMQHAGGMKGQSGTQATIKQDPASSFAAGNQDFIRQYGQDYANKGKKVGNIDDMMQHDEGSKRDIARILGEGPAKDPKFEKFFAHHHPLIGMSAHKTLNRLGLDPKHPDVDMSMLHEAGMHGLIQAMNDYDHDNPSKASFATHAGNKIRGLQMTAMKNQDQIPTEVRQAQKKFASQGAQPQAPKMDLHNVIQQSGHPKAADMGDRLKRVGSQRQAQAIKIKKA